MYFDLRIEAEDMAPVLREAMIESCILEGYSGIAFNYNHHGAMTKLSECSFEKKRFEESAKRSIEKLNLKKPEKLSKSFLIMTRITLHIDESKELVHLRVICY